MAATVKAFSAEAGLVKRASICAVSIRSCMNGEGDRTFSLPAATMERTPESYAFSTARLKANENPPPVYLAYFPSS